MSAALVLRPIRVNKAGRHKDRNEKNSIFLQKPTQNLHPPNTFIEKCARSYPASHSTLSHTLFYFHCRADGDNCPSGAIKNAFTVSASSFASNIRQNGDF
jgi:hypothetical protein